MRLIRCRLFFLLFSILGLSFTKAHSAIEVPPLFRKLTANFLLYTAVQQLNLFENSTDSALHETGEKLVKTSLRLLAGEALLANSSSKNIDLEAWSKEIAQKDRPALVFGPSFIKQTFSDPAAGGGIFLRKVLLLSRLLDGSPTGASSLESEVDILYAEAQFYREAVRVSPSKGERVVRMIDAVKDYPEGSHWVRFVSRDTGRDYGLRRKYSARLSAAAEIKPELLKSVFGDLVSASVGSSTEEVKAMVSQWKEKAPSVETLSVSWKHPLIKLRELLLISKEIGDLLSDFDSSSTQSLKAEIREAVDRLQSTWSAVTQNSSLMNAFNSSHRVNIAPNAENIRKNEEAFKKWIEEMGQEAEPGMLLPAALDT